MPSRTAGALQVVAVLTALAGIAAWFLTRPSVGETRAAAPAHSPEAAPGERSESPPPLPLPPPGASPVEDLEAPAVADAAPTTGLIVEVRATDGAPLEGMRVDALLLPDEQLGVTATTAADGTVWLDCAAGNFFISSRDDRADSRYAGASLESADVAATGPTRVTLTLIEATGRVDVFVRDDTGTPVAGVQLQGGGLAPKRGRGERYTDALGIATWEPVVAGGWDVRVQSTDPGSGVVNPRGRLRARLIVEPTGTTRHEFVLTRQGMVIARLADITNASQLAGMTIHSESQRDERRLEFPPEPSAKPIELAWRMAPGDYVLATEWKADSPWWSPPQIVTVRSGETTYVTALPRPCPARVTGRVRHTAGLPVAGVLLSLTVRSRVDRNGWMESAQDVLAEKTGLSGADGEWSIDVPAGMTRLTVDTAAAGNRYLARYENESEFDVTDFTRPVESVVAPGCVVVGRVEGHWAERAAAEDLKVFIVREQVLNRSASQRTDQLADDASFKFRHMGPGTYTTVLKRGGDVVTDTLRFEIPADFEEGATISVTLTFPE